MWIENRKHRWLLLALALVVLLGVLGYRYLRPDRLALVNELRARMKDETLPAEDRQAARSELERQLALLEPAERWQLVRDSFRRQLEGFFQLPGEEQQAFLDKVIDQIEVQRRQRETGSAASPPRPLKIGFDQTSPEDRSLAAEYLRRLSERCQERGLPPVQAKELHVNIGL